MARNIFNLVVSGVAAIATFAFTGNFAAAAAVFSLGNIALSLANPSTPSAQLDDIRATTSAYGDFIPIVYNEGMVGSRLVWGSKLRAKPRGHGGYEYGQDLKYLLCEGARVVNSDAYTEIVEIYLNNQLVFSIDPDADLSPIVDSISTPVIIDTGIGGNTFFGFFVNALLARSHPTGQTTTNGIQVITIRYGLPDQMPSTVMEKDLGAGNAAAYRGVITIDVDNCPLHAYGNSIPQLKAKVRSSTINRAQDFKTYDPIWAEGQPLEPHTEWTGYREMHALKASPTYHPDTMMMVLGDNEEFSNAPWAIARFDAKTGEFETTTVDAIPVDLKVKKVALIDYLGDGGSNLIIDPPSYSFIWDTYGATVHWPPTSDKVYTFKYQHWSTSSSSTSWWVELDADYPFAFSKKSQTPAQTGRSGDWLGLWSISSNSDGSLLVGSHNDNSGNYGSGEKWSVWAPGSNVVSYFARDDAAFAGLWNAGTSHVPRAWMFDKHDHLWSITEASLGAPFTGDGTKPVHLDEFSVTVGVSSITLTHLNRYALNNQVGGQNTWFYEVRRYGWTYNETLDEFVFYWHVVFPLIGASSYDPPLVDFSSIPTFSEQFSEHPQTWITHWDLATRTKKFSAADSVRVRYDTGGYISGFEDFISGIASFGGSEQNYSGDRFPGTWTEQTWTVLADSVGDFSGTGVHVSLTLIDTTTGIGHNYGPKLWNDFLPDSYNSFDDIATPGVYWFAGSIYEPSTGCFWAGRRPDEGENEPTDATETAFLSVTEGFGRYFIGEGSVPAPWTLQQIVEDQAERTGSLVIAEDTDFSALADIIPKGYVVTSRRAARDNIEDLKGAYLFDLFEQDWLLVAKLREGNEAIVTIPEDDVLVDGENRHFVFTDANEQELPRWIDLTYYNIDDNHQIGIEPARIGGGAFSDRNAMKISVAVVMDPDEAATTAQRILRAGWQEKDSTKFALPTKYLPYGPADVAVLTRKTFSIESKFTDNAIGVNWAAAFEAVKHDSGLYSVTAQGTVASFVPPPPLTAVPKPIVAVIDTSMTEEVDDTVGLFVTAFPSFSQADGGNWTGADIERGTSSASFSYLGRIEDGPVAGRVTELLPEYEEWATWDRDNTLKVYLTNGELFSVDEDRLWQEPLLNLALVGNELIQFATAFENQNGEWWLTDLLRGRLGTEQLQTHAVDEPFVLFDKTKFIAVTYDAYLIDAVRYYRAKNESAAQFSDIVSAPQTTRRLMPYAPYNLQVEHDPSGDHIIVTFLRRSRTRGAPLNDSPLFETVENYEADILTPSGTLKRTITTTASAGGSVITIGSARHVLYSNLDQIADFGSLVAEGGAIIRIYQMNAIRGRGYPGEETL